MTEFIHTWVVGITCAAIVWAIAESLIPIENMRRICMLAGGIMLLMAVIMPIVELDAEDLESITAEFDQVSRRRQEELQMEQSFLYESIIEENTAAYILDKARELGVACTVHVTVAWRDEIPIPHTVRVKGVWTAEQHDALSQFIETELGISEAMQYFEESES